MMKSPSIQKYRNQLIFDPSFKLIHLNFIFLFFLFSNVCFAQIAESFDSSLNSDWIVVDATNATSGPSSWLISEGELIQTSNIYKKTNKIGTYLYYDLGFEWDDASIQWTQTSDDNDGLGLMFRYMDHNNYYRFSTNLQRSYRRLEKNVDGVFTILAEDTITYTQGVSQVVRIETMGDRIQVFVDGNMVFDVTDFDHAQGSLAFYSYGNTGAHFDNLIVNKIGSNQNQPPINVTGLLSHWALDETKGSVAVDNLGNNNGALTNSPIWRPTQGQFGGALEFDGNNDRVDLGNIDVSGTEMSIAFWFKADDFGTADARFISKAKGTSSRDHYWMVSTLSNSRLRFRLKTKGYTTTLVSSSNVISTNQWHHVTATYDGSEMRIYRDGELVASTANTGVLDTNSNVPVSIGNQPSNAGSKPFDGLIDDVRIYTHALTVDQIQTVIENITDPVPPETDPVPPEIDPLPSKIGLLSHWTLDESNGSFAPDVLGNNNGTLLNFPVWQPNQGQIGGSLEFDGVNDYINLDPIDVSGSEISLSFWFKADDFDIGDARFISKASSPSGEDHYWMVSTVNGSKLRFRLKTNGVTNTLISPAGTIFTGQWHHVTATYDGNEMKIYRDGELVASTAKTGDIDTNNSVAVAIGNQPSNAGSKPFDGLIDDVRIYTTALTVDQIQAVIAGGGTLPTPTPTPTPNDNPPAISIISPVNGATISSSFNISANASDDNAITDVQFQIDGVNFGSEDMTAPYSKSFDSTIVSDGLHTITAIATDSANQIVEKSINITVSNASLSDLACSDGIDNDGDGLIDYPEDLGCTSLNDNSEVDSTEDGSWTTFIPSADTRIVYVSNSTGSDSTCKSYAASQISDPFHPASSFTPCKTISKATTVYDALPNNEPHWLLFKSGDTWTNQSLGKWEKSGRSVTEPALLASYGDSNERPKVLTGSSSFSGAINNGVKYITLADLFIQAHTWNSTDGKGGPRAFRWLSNTSAGDWVFEGMYIRDYETGFLIGSSSDPYRGKISNITFRNNTFAGNQGTSNMYVTGVNGLKVFEGNTFYDNGYWNNHTDGAYRAKHIYLDNENGYPAGGDPTGHSIYRNNFFIDSAAYGFHARTGGEIANNYVESHGYGIVVGSHDGGQTWPIVSTSVHDNVIMHLNDSLDQTLGYGIILENVDADVEGNIIAYYGSALPYGHPLFITAEAGNKSRVRMSNNTVYSTEGDIRIGSNVAPVEQTNNLINDDMVLLSTNVRSNSVKFVDPNQRDLAKYNRDVLGGTRDVDDFMDEALKQWRGYFRPEYTVTEVNDYIRRGFEPDGSQSEMCNKGAVACGFGAAN